MSRIGRGGREIRDLTSGLIPALRKTAIAVVGAWLAWEWTAGHRAVPLAGAAACLAVAYLADWTGRRLLPERPVAALSCLELWVLAPSVLAVVASAMVIGIAIALSPSEAAPELEKEVGKALAAAFGGFLTASFVTHEENDRGSVLAQRIQRTFAEYYVRSVPPALSHQVKVFAPESAGERWVHSATFRGQEGWSLAARRARARGLEQELRTGASDPPP